MFQCQKVLKSTLQCRINFGGSNFLSCFHSFNLICRDRSGKPPTLVQALSMGELRNRIIQHMPPQPEKQNVTMKRSQSTGGLSVDYDHLEDLEMDDPGRATVPHRRLM